ncbi:hypothetical protein PROP_00200 [Propionicimonas sp. T2.31MG-18]|uniref:prepilin peptidase n=1 Tax=Propionicimonas sp. T2.31MG-18 TaxID=3157620 RepID=UPI0035E4CF32
MPTPVTVLVAVLLSAAVALATPALLRRQPLPEDADDLPPFADLATPRFRLAVLVVSALATTLALLLTAPEHWAVWAPFTSLGALLVLVDLRTTYLPLRLNYLVLALSLAGAGVAAALTRTWQPLVGAAVTGAVAAGVLWLVWRASGGRLGFGDVRLAGLIGVVTGTQGLPLPVWAFVLGSATGAVWGVVSWLRRGGDGAFPYGPALWLGPLLALLVRRALLPG